MDPSPAPTGTGIPEPRRGIDYKWVALSNTTIATFMAVVNESIILISLPAIFIGINIDPLRSFQYLLWVVMIYGVVTATLLLTCGRLSDMFGRVRLYNIGFAIFTVGSILLFLTPGTGNEGAIELILFRLVQAVGASFIFSNSAAIITDAFPVGERGKALGFNMMAALSGQFIGLILGGVLAVFNWRYIFLVSVPFGIFGTIWSFWKLKDTVTVRKVTKIDIWGNIAFTGGLTAFLLGITFALLPYQNDSMGWRDPWVLTAIVVGLALLIAFPFIEKRVKEPMFDMNLFKIRMFTYANTAGFLGAIARGGVMFLLIVLLQGIWLPLHGYSYESTPFWAGIYMLPLTIGFVIMGPLSGYLSDKYGARFLSTAGMVIVTAAFIDLSFLPYNFDYLHFSIALFLMGLGTGMFAAPNTTAIMNSVPRGQRGVASGMVSTLMNTGFVTSMAMFFTILIVSLSREFPAAIATSLASAGASPLIPAMSAIPPTGAMFAAFLGFNPVQAILTSLPPALVNSISPQTLSTLTGIDWFPNTLAQAFLPSLRVSFWLGAALAGAAAVLSAARGPVYIREAEEIEEEEIEEEIGDEEIEEGEVTDTTENESEDKSE